MNRDDKELIRGAAAMTAYLPEMKLALWEINRGDKEINRDSKEIKCGAAAMTPHLTEMKLDDREINRGGKETGLASTEITSLTHETFPPGNKIANIFQFPLPWRGVGVRPLPVPSPWRGVGVRPERLLW